MDLAAEICGAADGGVEKRFVEILQRMADDPQRHAGFRVPQAPAEGRAFLAEHLDERPGGGIARDLADHFGPDRRVEGLVFDLDSRHGGNTPQRKKIVDWINRSAGQAMIPWSSATEAFPLTAWNQRAFSVTWSCVLCLPPPPISPPASSATSRPNPNTAQECLPQFHALALHRPESHDSLRQQPVAPKPSAGGRALITVPGLQALALHDDAVGRDVRALTHLGAIERHGASAQSRPSPHMDMIDLEHAILEGVGLVHSR